MKTFRMLWLVALVGCADRELDAENPTTDQPAAPTPLDVLARVERDGSTMEWVPGATIFTGRTNAMPLLDLDTAEKLRPVELYLALAGDARIPERLAPYATATDRALASDPAQLSALRKRVSDRAAELAREIAAATPAIHERAGSCTAGQIATARSAFGRGYTDAQTCGDHLGFIDSYPDYLYCNDGPGGDCEYDLGRTDGYVCPLSDPCDYAAASVHARAMRSNTWGNAHFVSSGHRIRGLGYNCTGNGPLTMSLRYGDGDWDTQVSIDPGFYKGVYVWGSGLLQERTIAIDLVGNGHIYDGIGASGATFKSVEYEISGNAGTNDRGIFCTDTQQSLTITGTSNPQSCGHGNVSWCNGLCGGGCFE